MLRPLQNKVESNPRIIQGPGVGLDCAVIDLGDTWLVLKSDPITFAADQIGWYAVQVNANDLATTGAMPRWFLATVLLPERTATPYLAEQIFRQISAACEEIGALLIGGHTEVTIGLDRPIVAGTLLGEVEPEKIVSPCGAQPGDRLLLTKGVPIEATSIMGRDFSLPLSGILSADDLQTARDFLYTPGISILKDAQTALAAGRVHAMHDPTEGGLYTALWELAEASGHAVEIDLTQVMLPELSARMCIILGIDPLAAIASGALLLAVQPEDAGVIRAAVEGAGIPCAEIGRVVDGPQAAWSMLRDGSRELLQRPERDDIARLFEKYAQVSGNES